MEDEYEWFMKADGKDFGTKRDFPYPNRQVAYKIAFDVICGEVDTRPDIADITVSKLLSVLSDIIRNESDE